VLIVEGNYSVEFYHKPGFFFFIYYSLYTIPLYIGHQLTGTYKENQYFATTTTA
jgi:hypothetical protein